MYVQRNINNKKLSILPITAKEVESNTANPFGLNVYKARSEMYIASVYGSEAYKIFIKRCLHATHFKMAELEPN